MRNIFLKDAVMLGDERVEVKKLTYNKYRKMSDAFQKLPGVIFSLLTTPDEYYYQSAIAALDMTAEELIEVVAVLSEVDAEYLKEHAGLNEIVDYLIYTYKRNDFAKTVKNVQSLRTEMTEKEDPKASQNIQ